MIGGRAAQPHDLRGVVVLRGAEGRFRVGAIFLVGVTLDLVEERDQPLSRVEGGLRRVLDLTPDLIRGGRR